MMSDWTRDELTRIESGEEIQIAPRRRDGTLRKPVKRPRSPSETPPSNTSPRAAGRTQPKTADESRSRGVRPRLSIRSHTASTSIRSATKALKGCVAPIRRISLRG